MKTISLADLRKNLADVVGETAYAKERYVLTRRGKAMVAIIPIEDLEFLEKVELEMDSRDFLEASREDIPFVSLDKAKEELGLT